MCLGLDPKTGLDVFLRAGPYGAYVQLGESPAVGVKGVTPRRASLKLNGYALIGVFWCLRVVVEDLNRQLSPVLSVFSNRYNSGVHNLS